MKRRVRRYKSTEGRDPPPSPTLRQLRADFLSIHQPTLRPQNRAAAALYLFLLFFPLSFFFRSARPSVDRTAYPFEKKKSRKKKEREREREAREKEDPSPERPVRARFSPLFSASVPFDLLPPHLPRKRPGTTAARLEESVGAPFHPRGCTRRKKRERER